jgi:hypothetical protein
MIFGFSDIVVVDIAPTKDVRKRKVAIIPTKRPFL